MDVEILSVGRELLIGRIANTNAQWLAQQIEALGHRVARITVVDDIVEDIARVLKEIYERGVKLIILTGGLGPTFDDKTLEGVATAFNLKLTLNREALQMVQAKYAAMIEAGIRSRIELTDERCKMAMLPEGGHPLSNPKGTAPGVLLKEDETMIIALPGVPAEMKAIFSESVRTLVQTYPSPLYTADASIQVTGIMESELAPIIVNVVKLYPKVYIKSHPQGAEDSARIELHCVAKASTEREATAMLNEAVESLKEQLASSGQASGGERRNPAESLKSLSW